MASVDLDPETKYSPEAAEEIRRQLKEKLADRLQDITDPEKPRDKEELDALKQVGEQVKAGDYKKAQEILEGGNVKWTDEMRGLAVDLNHLEQLGNLDKPKHFDLSEAKGKLLETKDKLVEFSKGQDRTEARLDIENVANAQSGTMESGLEELESVLQMIEGYLKDKSDKFQEKDRAELNENDAQELEEILEMRSVRDTLYGEKMNRLEHGFQHDNELASHREESLDHLDKVYSIPGVSVDQKLKNQFETRISTMNMEQLMHLNGEAQSVLHRYQHKEITGEQVSQEISSWFTRKFTKEEEKERDQEQLRQTREKLHNF